MPVLQMLRQASIRLLHPEIIHNPQIIPTLRGVVVATQRLHGGRRHAGILVKIRRLNCKDRNVAVDWNKRRPIWLSWMRWRQYCNLAGSNFESVEDLKRNAERSSR